jgi:HD-GYP domain-containing protein (c-di-GMP phosphodiesterase class II)
MTPPSSWPRPVWSSATWTERRRPAPSGSNRASSLVPETIGIPTGILLAALSTALDLTEGQLPGHSLRTCFLALRVADALGLLVQDRRDVFHAAFLKDAGCSSNAAAGIAI